MSIRFITGKPGGGKGLLAVKQIVDELEKGDRAIITNVALRVEPWVRQVRKFGKIEMRPEIGLRHYLLKAFGRDFNVRERVKILDDEEVATFFLHRKNGAGFVKLDVTEVDGGQVKAYDTTKAIENGGVLYVTDESWKFFNSRDWQKTGKGVLYYAAQHRHFGDDWFIVTQHTKQIETVLRQVTQEFWLVRNHGKMSIGRFRQPNMFTFSIFELPPVGGQSMEPMERRSFRLDKKGLGACYDTSAGVGIHGAGSADLGERKRGLPFWVMILALCVLGVLIWKSPRLFGWYVSKMMKRGKNGDSVVEPAVKGGPGVGLQGVLPASGGPVAVFEPAGGGWGVRPVEEAPVEAVGWHLVGGKMVVLLSDGSIARGLDVQYVSDDWCVVRGERVKVRSSSGSVGPSIDLEKYLPKWEVPPALVNDVKSSIVVIGGNSRGNDRPMSARPEVNYRGVTRP